MKKLHEYLKQTFIIIISVILFITSSFVININYSNAAILEPAPGQKIEYRAVSLEETEKGNQLIIEIWLHKLDFKGIDLRLQLDSILKTSDMQTNEVIDVEDAFGIPSCFEFVGEFANYMDYFAMSMEAGEIRGILSIDEPVDNTGAYQYLKSTEQIKNYVSVEGDALLAKLSFNVGDITQEKITQETIKLKAGSTSPKTGIKININGSNLDSYEAESLFEFNIALSKEGTVEGKIQLGNGLRDSMEASYGVTTKYIADITLYKPGAFNWEGIVPGDASLEELDSVEYVIKAKSDEEGNYSMEVEEGIYDCIIEKKGFLAQIIKNVKINIDEVTNLGERILLEGDSNRSGSIDLDDMIDIVNLSGASVGDSNYDEKYDFGQKGFIGLDDLVSTTTNLYNTISIEEYKK